MKNSHDEGRSIATDIGWAVKNLRRGNKVCRSGWNGKNMYLIHSQESNINVAKGEMLARHYAVGTELEVLDSVWMYTADKKLVPWLCSQTDLFATDWEIAK